MAILGRLNTASEIRKALTELPETLDETYERVLLSIPAQQLKIARKALQLISVWPSHLCILEDLREAVVVDVENPAADLNSDCQLLHSDSLLSICTCLIIHVKNSEIRLAHYTVKEYLISERIQHGPAAYFFVSDDAAKALFTKTAIVNLLQEPQSSPFWGFAVRHWYEYVMDIENITDRTIINHLVLKLFNPCAQNFKRLWEESAEYDKYLPNWHVPLGAEELVTMGYACYYGLSEIVQILLRRKPESVKLNDHLKRFHHSDSAGSLVLEDSLLDVTTIGRFESGYTPGGYDKNEVVALAYVQTMRMLLAAGADPSFPRGIFTPLQRAVMNGELEMVELLLHAGANVNAIGDDNAILHRLTFNHLVGWYSNIGTYISLDDQIRERGYESFYHTPLECLAVDDAFDADAIKDLLIRHGAKSLHLFPHPDLPGYVEEDMITMRQLKQQPFIIRDCFRCVVLSRPRN